MIVLKNGSKVSWGVGLLLCCVFLGLFGCARTVTKQSTVLEIEIKLTFRESPDRSKYRYYVAFSDTAAPSLPTIPPAIYFPTPGSTFNDAHPELGDNDDAVTGFYTPYFSSWTDYVVLTSSEAKLFKSNANGFTATTTDDHLSYIPDTTFDVQSTVSGSTWTLRFPVQSLSPSNPSSLYFNFFTSHLDDTPITESGTLEDTLNNQSNDAVISIQSNEKVGPLTDPQDTTTGASDLISWEVRVL